MTAANIIGRCDRCDRNVINSCAIGGSKSMVIGFIGGNTLNRVRQFYRHGHDRYRRRAGSWRPIGGEMQFRDKT